MLTFIVGFLFGAGVVVLALGFFAALDADQEREIARNTDRKRNGGGNAV